MTAFASLDWSKRFKPYWPLIKRLLSSLYLGLVLVLVALLAWRLDWSAVHKGFGDLTLPTLLTAAVLAALSHLAYSTFDLIGRT